MALHDVEINGHLFREGEGVIVALDVANRDPSAFPDPNRFDITRTGLPHLGFGYGVHQCPGSMYARLELRAVFSQLFVRLPDLALSVPFETLEFKNDAAVFGCTALPVTRTAALRARSGTYRFALSTGRPVDRGGRAP